MQVPAQMERHVAGRSRELAWQSAERSLTWRVTAPSGQVRYLKTAPADAAMPLRAEAARLRWARANGVRVPAVIAACGAGGAEWLLTEALPGRDAMAADLRADRQDWSLPMT